MYIVSQRPWGKFEQYTHNETTTVKVITVDPHQKLSVQRHKERDELWVGLDDNLIAYLNEQEVALDKGVQFYIPRNSIHSIENIGDVPARFLEIAFGYFDEEDIERLDDMYGRI